MFKRLKYKFAFINLFLCGLLIITTFSILLYSSAKQMEMSSYDALKDSQRHFDTFGDGMFDGGPKDGGPNQNREMFNTMAVLVNGNNEIIDTYNISSDIDDLKLEQYVLKILDGNVERGKLDDTSYRFLVEKHGADTVISFIDYSFETEYLTSQLINYILVGIVSLIILFALSLYLSSLAIKPIEKSSKQQKQFFENVSHELKTPLTVILSNTSLLKDNGAFNKEQSEYLNYIEQESQRMNKLVLDMLDLSKVENKIKYEYRIFDLSKTMMSTSLMYDPVFYENHRKLEEDISSEVMIDADEAAIKQVLHIILDNACKYSSENTSTSLSLVSEKNFAVITIENNFDGEIIQEELEKIFDRFYKIDRARTRNDSYGLGLSIAKQIINAHKGTMDVAVKNNIITFKIKIPLG